MNMPYVLIKIMAVVKVDLFEFIAISLMLLLGAALTLVAVRALKRSNALRKDADLKSSMDLLQEEKARQEEEARQEENLILKAVVMQRTKSDPIKEIAATDEAIVPMEPVKPDPIKEIAATDEAIVHMEPLEKEKPLLVRPLRKSYEQNLIKIDSKVKLFYDEFKNTLLHNKKVTSRISKKSESFRFGRETIVKLTISGKALKIYFALDPKKYDEEVFKHKDLSQIDRYMNVPLMIRVRSERSAKRALLFLKDVETKFDLKQKKRFSQTDYVKKLLNGRETPLGQIGLSSLIISEATQSDTRLISDKRALNCVQTLETRKEAKLAEKVDISLGKISEAFQSGKTVNKTTLKKLKLLNRTVGSINITAEGLLSKPLDFMADSYDIDAIKMILLTGGTVTKIKYQNKD